MAIESAAERLSMLTIFGESATLAGSAVIGILDKEYRVVGDIESNYPVFECRSTDATGVVHGSTLVVGAESFVIVGVEDDGTGMTVLVLRNA